MVNQKHWMLLVIKYLRVVHSNVKNFFFLLSSILKKIDIIRKIFDRLSVRHVFLNIFLNILIIYLFILILLCRVLKNLNNIQIQSSKFKSLQRYLNGNLLVWLRDGRTAKIAHCVRPSRF